MKRTLKSAVASLGMFAVVALSAAPVAAHDFDAQGRNRPVITAEGFKRPVTTAARRTMALPTYDVAAGPRRTSAAPYSANGRLRP